MEALLTPERAQELIPKIAKKKNDLTEWELNFIFGKEGESRGMIDRTWLPTVGQCRPIQKMAQRLGLIPSIDKAEKEIDGKNVKATFTRDGWSITIRGKEVGQKVTRREARLIVLWLDEALEGIESLKKTKNIEVPF